MEKAQPIPQNDHELLLALRENSDEAFERLYRLYAPELLLFAFSYCKDKAISEEMIQDVFLSLWQRRANINVQTSIKQYLYGAVKKKILLYIRAENTRNKYIEHLSLFLTQHNDNLGIAQSHISDIQNIIGNYLDTLPPKCKEVFLLSRFENKSITEIAELLKISNRTVENYITTALKVLRTALKDYHWVFLLFFYR